MGLSSKYNEASWADRRERLKRWTGYDILSAPVTIDAAPHLVAIVASHQSKHPEWSATWRHRLLTALSDCREKNTTVLYSLDNPIGAWIRDFARRLDVRHVRLDRLDATKEPADSNEKPLLLERLASIADSDLNPSLQGLPLVDRALFALADSVHAISVRPGSKTEQLTKAWLEERGANRGLDQLISYYSAVMQTLTSPQLDRAADGVLAQVARRSTSFGSLIIPRRQLIGSQFNTSSFLVHCTRGRLGRLPHQSPGAYADEMFAKDSDIESTPMQNLQKILSDRRVVATSYLKKDEGASVSLSNVPLLELLSRRQYRSHLQRWDWEPYGIGFRKSILEDRFSALKVGYDTEDKATGTKIDQGHAVSNKGLSKSRWAEEQEWRVPNDIRLGTLKFSDAFVFVKSASEALAIAHLTPFPIAVVAE